MSALYINKYIYKLSFYFCKSVFCMVYRAMFQYKDGLTQKTSTVTVQWMAVIWALIQWPEEIHFFSHLGRAITLCTQSEEEERVYCAVPVQAPLSDVGRWVMAIHPSALLCLHILPVLKTCSGFIGWKTTGAPQTLQLKSRSHCTADQRWNLPDAPRISGLSFHHFSFSAPRHV